MMADLQGYVLGLAAIALLAVATWSLSLWRGDVSIVDSLWSMLFLAATCIYVQQSNPPSMRAWLVLALVSLWALRLAIYITARNWGEPEDRRYQAIRARNQPNFAIKSLYLVFLLQGALAWIVSLPLFVAASSTQPLSWLDYLGGVVVAFGLAFEAIGDWQLARFKADPGNQGRVMDRGLWRYTRHPNYFGESCVWWGFYLLALAAGGWWSIVAPILMTAMLLKVSGVALLEKDIAERRPRYEQYIRQTNAFIPGPRRSM
jgi:steroid 5-alpha reductase family enzyme